MVCAGVTVMVERVALLTLSVAVPLTEPNIAVIVAGPGLRPDATPAIFTVATVVSLELQVALRLMS